MNSSSHFTLTIASHFFRVNSLSPRAKFAVLEFSKRFVRYGTERMPGGRFIRTAVSVYAAANDGRTEFRYHINCLKQFKEFMELQHFKEDLYTIVHKPLHEGLTVDLPMRPSWVLRPDQNEIVEYLNKPGHPISHLVGLQTGKGKTVTATKAASDYGKRVVLIVRPMYVGKWVSDFSKILDVKPDDIVSVRGGAQLQALLMLAQTKQLEAKLIIISNKTLQLWLKEYELKGKETLDLGYACLPEDMYELLGAGLRLMDEVHLDYHLNFRIDLYSNVPRSTSLSATLLNNDKFLESMYELGYPLDDRYKGAGLHKYAHAIAFLYHIRQDRKYMTTEYGSPTYSHNAFERSILKNHDFTASYLAMIGHIVQFSFIENYKPGQKFAVFAASIAMCTAITGYLQALYPHLKVNRYVEDDPDENLLESDIPVTTVLSGGTAHDISGLKGLLLTNSISSLQSNIQVLGRLREIVGQDVVFLYMACMDVPKSMEYHEQKVKMLHERAASVKIMLAPKSV